MLVKKNSPRAFVPNSSPSLGVTRPRGTNTIAVKDQTWQSTSAPLIRQGDQGLEAYGAAQDMSPLLSGFSYSGEDPQNIGIYLDMYYYDSVCGSAADIMSTMPFSEYKLRGLSQDDLTPFEESLGRLKIGSFLPDATIDYLVGGVHCSSLLFDRANKVFLDSIPHAMQNMTVDQLPFYGEEPIISVKFPPEMVKRMSDRSHPRIAELTKRYGSAIIDKIIAGVMDLDPLSTIYLPRRTQTARGGISWFRRALPYYLYEKNIFRGTLAESVRRQRPVTHVQMGDENWEPKPEDYDKVAQMFIEADQDPLGAIVVTRMGLQVDEVRSSADLWKIDDVLGTTVPAKLRALGIGESFLSGDQVYDCVVGSTLIPTEIGMKRIDELHPELHRCTGLQKRTFNIDLKVDGRHGSGRATHVHYVGVAPTTQVTAGPHTVRGTAHHRLLGLLDGAESYRNLSDFGAGDWVAASTSASTQDHPVGGRFQLLPGEARWLGALYYNGNVLRANDVTEGVDCISANADIVLAFAETAATLYGISPDHIEMRTTSNNRGNVPMAVAEIRSPAIVKRLKQLNILVPDASGSKVNAKGAKERINPWPNAVLQATTAETSEFLAQVFDARASFRSCRAAEPVLTFQAKYNNLIRLTAVLCQRLGAYAQVLDPETIYVGAHATQVLRPHIEPFLQVIHVAEVNVLDDTPVPIDWLTARPEYSARPWSTEPVVSYAHLATAKFESFWTDLSAEDARKVNTLLKSHHHWVRVDLVEAAADARVYDLTIQDGSEPSYTVNGLVGHNTGQQGSISTLIEGVKAHRSKFERELFYEKIFPLISLTNGMFRTPQAEKLAREAGFTKTGGGPRDLSKLMALLRNERGLKIPTIEWSKPLRPEGDSAYMDTLLALTEKGVPVGIRMLAAAAQVDLEQIEAGMPEDMALRKRYGDFMKKISKFGPSESGARRQGIDANDIGLAAEESGYGTKEAATLVSAFAPSLSMPGLPVNLAQYGNLVPTFKGAIANAVGGRRKLTDRNFGEDEQEIFTTSVTGKKQWLVDQHRQQKRVNDSIITQLKFHASKAKR